MSPHPLLSSRSAEKESPPLPDVSVAMSKVETVVLSATGDVLVSRCRESSQAYMRSNNASAQLLEFAQRNHAPAKELSWWESDCGLDLAQNGWPCHIAPDGVDPVIEKGLLGGNPPKGGASDLPESDVRSKQNGVSQVVSATDTLSSTIPVSPKESKPAEGDFSEIGRNPEEETAALSPLPSFDYSHFADGGNDMIPSTEEPSSSPSKVSPPKERLSFLSSALEGQEKSGSEKAKSHPDIIGSKTELRSPLRPLPIDHSNHSAGNAGLELYPTVDDGLLATRRTVEPPTVLHGVPTFLSTLPQIRIKQVSAHPRGSHVLLISTEALLFAFGLNDHGQLGNGRASSVQDENLGFVTTPTIVTPLLENGGKATVCAAGVDHSLVVVQTEGRRLVRSHEKNPLAHRRHHRDEKRDSILEMTRVTSSPPRIVGTEIEDQSTTSSTTSDPSEMVSHHQLYGFGRNDYMKLGLVNPVVKENNQGMEDEEDVLLPRRVALHCSVWPDATGGTHPQGIFEIAASEKHSAALVRRATGAVELYTWGNADDGALGPHNLVDEMSLKDRSKSRKSSPNGKQMHSKGGEENAPEDITNMNGQHSRRLHQKVGVPSIVRKLSYIPSYENPGQFPVLGERDESLRPTPGASDQSFEQSPDEYPVHVALGTTCTFVVTSLGRCVSFGTSEDGLLGRDTTASAEPKNLPFPDTANGDSAEISSISVGARHAVALARDGSAYTWGNGSGGRLGLGSDTETVTKSQDRGDASLKNGSPPGHSDIHWVPEQVDVRSLSRSNPVVRHFRSFSDNDLRDPMEALCLDESTNVPETEMTNHNTAPAPVVHVCAGYDSTVFVTDSGRVLSCGEKSGRLGLGEVRSNVFSPEPMFGGLQLWRENQR